LGEEQAPGEVGAPDVGASEIGSGEIGQAQVGAPEVGADEARAPEAGAGQPGAVQVGADEVGSLVVRFLARHLGPYKFAGAEQQRIDLFPVPCGVQPEQSVSGAARHGFGRFEREAQLAMNGLRRLQGQRRGHVPQQLMKLPHHREHLMHLRRGLRVLAPVPSGEGDLGHLLARPEAVIRGATGKAFLSEIVVNAAPKVRLEMGTGMPRRLVDREIGRS
jgi:hypothetical protein